MASHFHPLKIKAVKQETSDCISVHFELPPELRETFAYEAGQHLTIRQLINGEEIRRNYSLCSSPGDDDLSIAIKQMPAGIFSNWAAATLQPGTVVETLPPLGKFTLPAGSQAAKHYVAFAAGSGITPVISIIKSILKNEPASTITLVYGNRDRHHIIFKETLEALKNRYLQRFMLHYIFSRERADAPIFEGRIDAEKCALLFRSLIYLPQVDDVFICGPGGMIDTVRGFLEEQHFPKERVHYELFTAGNRQQKPLLPITEEKDVESEAAQVTIKLDGAELHFPLAYNGASILDAALQRGADLPYACKSGVCCTCKGKLVKGRVSMDENYGLEQEEMNAGYILTCQSHPVTNEVVVDFD